MGFFSNIKNLFGETKVSAVYDSSINSYNLPITKMLEDPQIKAVINLKKMLTLNGTCQVHPFSNNKEDIEIANFVREVLFLMDSSVSSVLANVLDCYIYGFSCQEIVYKKLDNGLIGIKNIKNLNTDYIDFDFDDCGNVVSVKYENQEINPIKYVLYSYNSSFGSPYGKSDLISVKGNWEAKQRLLKFYNIYLEKYGSPVVKGTYKRGFSPENQVKLMEVLKSIKQKTALLVPEDVEIENMNLANGGGNAYEQAILYHDLQIAKAILGQTIFTNDSVTVGSYSLANIHLNILDKCLENVKKDLEEAVVTEQIIKPLVALNFSTNNYPTFSISSISPENLRVSSEALIELMKTGIISEDEYWIRDYLQLPAKTQVDMYKEIKESENVKSDKTNIESNDKYI